MVKTTQHESFTSGLCPCKSLARRIHHIIYNIVITQSYICEYTVTSKDNCSTVTPTDLITEIRLSISTLKLHHAGINPDLVGIFYLQAGRGISLKLHGESNTTIIKMVRWPSPTFLMYIHNQIGHISKVLAQKMSKLITFLNISAIKT